jgi:hypothetical protein
MLHARFFIFVPARMIESDFGSVQRERRRRVARPSTIPRPSASPPTLSPEPTTVLQAQPDAGLLRSLPTSVLPGLPLSLFPVPASAPGLLGGAELPLLVPPPLLLLPPPLELEPPELLLPLPEPVPPLLEPELDPVPPELDPLLEPELDPLLLPEPLLLPLICLSAGPFGEPQPVGPS